jgi:hypothetical protein
VCRQSGSYFMATWIPNLIPPSFFLWIFIKDKVYFPFSPANVRDLGSIIHRRCCRSHAKHASWHMRRNTLQWDVCCATSGSHIEL